MTKFTLPDISVNQTSTETCLAHISYALYKYCGVDQSAREMSPLVWYIGTGRAPVEFIRRLIQAKPFMIARKLHMGGSREEVIDRICKYIGFERS